MRSVRIAVLLPVSLLALANCGTSPKTHDFTLAEERGPASERASINWPVTVAAVHLPASLDRSEIVLRTGENTVQVNEQDRWAGPLGEMTRRVLSEDLAARLPRDKVILPDAPLPPGTRQIVVTVVQFGLDTDGRTVLAGSWSLLEGDAGKPVLHRDIALETNSRGKGGGDQAAGMSQLLGQLAVQIAATLTRST